MMGFGNNNMNRKNNSKKHHYIPQYYLKGFSTSGDSSKVWAFDRRSKKAFCASTLNIGHENYFYASKDIHGEIDTDSVETFLANSVEGPANPIIDKVRNIQPINKQEKSVLAKYMAYMLSRVPRYRERIKEKIPQFLEELKARTEIEIKKSNISQDSQNRILQTIERELSAALPNLPDGLKHPILHEDIFEILNDMNWLLLSRENSPYFLTCDNPFLFTERRGLLDSEAEIIFPISKSVALLATRNHNKDIDYMPVEESFVQQVNKYVALNATRYVYYCEDVVWVHNLL